MPADNEPPPVEDMAQMVRFLAMLLAQGHGIDTDTMLRIAGRQRLPANDSPALPLWRKSTRAVMETMIAAIDSDAFFTRGDPRRN